MPGFYATARWKAEQATDVKHLLLVNGGAEVALALSVPQMESVREMPVLPAVRPRTQDGARGVLTSQ
jgi:hypothetical protein